MHHYRHPVGALLWELPAGLCDLEGEEAFLTTRWLPLEEVVSWVLDQRITNSLAVGGILAAAHQLRTGARLPQPVEAAR